MIKKNDELNLKIQSLGCNGEGVAKEDGNVFFVPYTLPGEKVRVKVLRVKDSVIYCKMLEVFTPAEERVRPACKVFLKCGGCQLQHMKYSLQVKIKQQNVKDCLSKIAGISFPVPPLFRSVEKYAYRNKLQLPIGELDGKTVLGFYAERSHRIIPIESCPIHPDWSTTIISIIAEYIKKFKIKGYNDETGEGLLRHLVVRNVAGKFIITLVATQDSIPEQDTLIKMIANKFKVFTLYLNINKTGSNVVFGKDFKLLYGEGAFETKEGFINYEVGPNTFVQVNDEVRKKLYEVVCDLVQGEDKEDYVVVDAYSGGGLLTAMLAGDARHTYGIEIVEEAVKCANVLKQRNGLGSRVTNICGDVEVEFPKLIKVIEGEKIVVVLDPPRKGVDRNTIKMLLSVKPEKIVMVSCNPSTMARDVGLLTGALIEKDNKLEKNEAYNQEEGLNGYYNISKIQCFDMFPQTKHVETVVCLKRK